ncbi:secreted RxLR effector protein 161-like [Lathyrus oleraceus]|uniref:secreted RxLR effector protein 161-like n=1 Tax=Pisum sativum TaxID=3888 RepID=UPI0021CFD364|nr:secreted RxLR effector protein 161-like [Pisum sativum]
MEDSIFLCQRKYDKNIVKKFGLENASHKRTPAPTHLKLSKDEKGISVDQSLYRSMILKYVNGTCDYGMLYSHDSNSMLVGYCDDDWVGSVDDRKSTSGVCFFLGNNLISWFNMKQNCVSLSTAEVKYRAVGSSCSQLMWMK